MSEETGKKIKLSPEKKFQIYQKNGIDSRLAAAPDFENLCAQLDAFRTACVELRLAA